MTTQTEYFTDGAAVGAVNERTDARAVPVTSSDAGWRLRAIAVQTPAAGVRS